MGVIQDLEGLLVCRRGFAPLEIPELRVEPAYRIVVCHLDESLPLRTVMALVNTRHDNECDEGARPSDGTFGGPIHPSAWKANSPNFALTAF